MNNIPADWRDLLLLLPGYNPIETAGDAWFDPPSAQRAIAFIEECIQHIEGDKKGEPFLLERWQKSFVANLFGWKRKDEIGRTVRRYRESLLYVPRKNGKTPLAAAVGLYVFFLDGEAGQQNYIYAKNRLEAGKLFRQMKAMVQAEPELAKRCRIFGGTAQAGQAKSIVLKNDETSFIQVNAGEAEHGGTAHLQIIDELHEQPDRDLVDTASTATASLNRKQPLFLMLTTADVIGPSICNEKYDYAVKVRDGITDDPEFLPVVYEAPHDADWRDEAVWRKANPNLGVSIGLGYLRRECQRAKEIPAFENTFRRLHLNQQTEQALRVVPMDRWKSCARQIDRDALRGRPCRGGLDIGATSDFTAFALLFPHDDAEEVQIPVNPEEPEGATRTVQRRSYTLLSWFWLPERPVRRNPRLESLIQGWRRAGHVRTTPGEVVDYDLVLDDIVKIVAPYQLVDIAFDRGFQGSQMGNNLLKQFGESMVFQFPQGIVSMNAPFREFLELIILERLHHDGNPTMTWMAGNVAAETRGGLIKPSKERSAEKIDGVTAACMGLGRWMAEPVQFRSVYEDRGLLWLDGGDEDDVPVPGEEIEDW